MRKIILLVAFAFACTTPPPERVIPEPKTYDTRVETVRDAVLATLSAMELAVEPSGDTTGIIRSARRPFKRHPVALYMDCGEDPLLGSYTGRPGFKAEYLMNVRLGADSTGTSLRVRASFFGRTNGRRHSCVSLGKLEGEFVEDFEARLGGAY